MSVKFHFEIPSNCWENCKKSWGGTFCHTLYIADVSGPLQASVLSRYTQFAGIIPRSVTARRLQLGGARYQLRLSSAHSVCTRRLSDGRVAGKNCRTSPKPAGSVASHFRTRVPHQRFTTGYVRCRPAPSSGMIMIMIRELCFCRWRTGYLAIPTFVCLFRVLALGIFTTEGENQNNENYNNNRNILSVQHRHSGSHS